MRSRRLAHAAVVLLTIAAWLVASDHCALARALLHPVVKAAENSCPGHTPQPAQPEKKDGRSDLPCCKSLLATTAPAKVSASYDASQFVLQPYLPVEFQAVAGGPATPVEALDTGPPDLRTFAESVLQRSLLAHAPPVLG